MRVFLRSLIILLSLSLAAVTVSAQGRVHTLFGDLHVDDSKAEGVKPLLYEVVLYNIGGTLVARQFVSPNGRYRFLNLTNGQYELAVMLENVEVARTRVEILAPIKHDCRQDLALEWRRDPRSSAKPATVSAADFYERTPTTQKLFAKANQATDRKKYHEAKSALQNLLAADPKDFQAWTELGTVCLLRQEYEEAEKAYLRAIAERKEFFLGLMNLGRLRILRQNSEGAIEPLLAAVKLKPNSADAHYYLGEAYLQLKKGSVAVDYLYKALELDPSGKAQAHLRLATLYNAVGLRQKAAAEYIAFLKKKPDHADRRKLERYIALNKG